jgi:tRNA A-37 threonylcarbamoyl transferase component Bud32
MTIKQHVNPEFAGRFSAFVNNVAAKGIPPEAVDVYSGRNRVAATPASGTDGRSKRLNIKEFRVPNALNRWVYAYLRRSKARRAFDNALRLRQLGFNTPAPIAWIERHGLGGRLELSYFISEQYDGWQEIRVAETENHPRISEIAAGVGELIFRLHRAGVWMKDASPGNILWHTDPDGALNFALVDINRMEFNIRSADVLMSNFGRVFTSEKNIETAARAYAAAAALPEDTIIAQAHKAIADACKAIQRKQRLKKLLP